MDKSREEFQQRLRSWLQDKGIIDKLVLYLRSQLFIELRNRSKETPKICKSDAVSPKHQAVKLLIADFLPALLKRNKRLRQAMVKLKKRNKYFKRAIRLEKLKVNRMYSLIQNTYSVVSKHKTELNLALQKQNEVLEKEVALNNKEEYLISKEKDFEQHCRVQTEDIEKKTVTLVEKDRELQKKYKKLLEEQEALNAEKLHWVEKSGQMYTARAYETVKLQEYEQKFHTLQNEVFEMLDQCRIAQDQKTVEVDKSNNKEIQCRFNIISQSQQTEANDTLNLEEYVNLMEKENVLLKSSSFKQRQCIAQLTTEIVFLKNRLDYLEKDLQIKTQFERRKEMNEVAKKLYSPRFTQSDRPKSLSTSNLKVSRRLFPKKDCPSSSELTSSTSKDDTSLTDELVAEAKSKLEQLENESEALNKNFKNLRTILSKNISFSDDTSQSASPVDKLTQ